MVDSQCVSVRDLEILAAKNLSKAAYDYYRSGANASISLKDNEEAFTKFYLKTSVFANKGPVSLESTIMGQKVNSPICIASTAFHKMAHQDGELATARAANAYNATTLKLSSWSTTALEEVAAQAPDSLKFFQIYLSKIPEVNQDLFDRVRGAGYKALHLTIDTQILGKRENDVRNNFQLPQGLGLANYAKYQKSHGEESNLKSSGKDSALAEYVKNHKDANLGWEVIPKLKQLSQLPVVAKGIMCAEDALLALQHGADAIFVSNHGARQLDTTPATIEVLEEVIEAVRGAGSSIEVYFDGGIRRGTDILKAMALGAQAVFLGRAILWALAANGQPGVERVLAILTEELKEAMVQTGCNSIQDIHAKGKSLFYRPEELDIIHVCVMCSILPNYDSMIMLSPTHLMMPPIEI